MYIEERIGKMEETIQTLTEEIAKLSQRNTGEILTPKEFAQKAKLNENTVYCWIREGKIKVLPHLGTALRIPMSQFYDEDEANIKLTKSDELRQELLKTIRSRKK